jgi:DUF1680 family protein
MLRAKRYPLTILITLLSLNSAVAERVPTSVVVGQDVYRATDPGQVSMEGFLGNRMELNREGWLKRHTYQADRLLAGFRERPGSISWDKSLNAAYAGEYVGKWLHAAMLAMENKPNDTTLARRVQEIASGLMDCQTDDGYLGTYLKQDRWGLEWEHGWDVWVHKYVLIGLLSYYRSTGDERALDTCRGIGDLLIQTFGDDKRDLIKSGQHAGMASTSLLEPMSLLYQYTGEKKYRQFCEYIVRRADAGPKFLTNIETTGAVHSVGDRKAYEMMSTYVGLVEHWRATGYERGLNAVKLAWESIARDNLFITGAPASEPYFSRESETFDTLGKCVETCDQVTWIQMNWQLLRATGEPRYAAMLHRHIYNHMLTAQHPDEMKWCYYTYMEGTHYYPPGHQDGYTDRMHCCSSSGPRGIALIPSFAYMSGKDTLAINLYETSTFRASVNGVPVVVHQETNYPWDGRVTIDLEVDQPTAFDLKLLIPNFAQSATIQVSGSKQNIPIEAGNYATLRRTWSGKTQIVLDLPMPVVAHERDERYALSRGPIVLALEGIEDDAATFQNVIPDRSSLQQASWKQGEMGFGTADQRTWAIERHPIYLKGKRANAENKTPSSEVTLVYRPYCEAATSPGQIFSVWLPMLTNEVYSE